jgi:hypothetical protein
MKMVVSELAGRWKIVSWLQRYDDGRVTYPFGEAITGFIQYDDKNVFVLLEKANRAKFSGGQWTASAAEKAGAYDSFMSYSGTYELDGEYVLHKIESSIFPNWEGGVQRRRMTYKDGQLTLSARVEEGTPEARTAELVWERSK